MSEIRHRNVSVEHVQTLDVMGERQVLARLPLMQGNSNEEAVVGMSGKTTNPRFVWNVCQHQDDHQV